MTSPTGSVVLDLAQFSKLLSDLVSACLFGSFLAVALGFCFACFIHEGAHVFLLRRSRTWRRFQRALRKVMQ